MTMCVIWKDHDAIHAATDSRLNFTPNQNFDYCVKVSNLKCQLLKSEDESDYEADNEIFKMVDLTIVFCGGISCSYTIKESLNEILNKIVCSEPHNVTFESIVDVAFTVYREVTSEILKVLMNEIYGCIFYIIGLCPKNNKMKCYKLYFNKNTRGDGFDYIKEEMFTHEDYEISGSGLKYLERSNNINNIIKKYQDDFGANFLLHMLSDVINDSACSSVGGAIQYASCKNRGTTYWCTHTFDGETLKIMRAGVDLNELNMYIRQKGMFIEISSTSGMSAL
ncbi:hypothetical protein WP8W19C02_P20490 (plasmid) [Enterobacter cloacae]|nr:hypothetical protein WP8W19C02_P20490 [Enterobacter cloacae]